MQSTQQSKAIAAVYSNSPVYAKALPQESKAKGIDRPFVISCCLGAVTVIFGMAALVYQFTPEFSRLKDASGQGEMPKIGTLPG
jgi:hypothetical protein